MWPFMGMTLLPHDLDPQIGKRGAVGSLDAILNATIARSMDTLALIAGQKGEERREKDHTEKGRRNQRNRTQRP